MRLPLAPRLRRRGLSLLEVLAALTIFLLCFSVVGGLISYAADRAIEVERQSLAVQMCQSKLNEVVAGVVPLQSASGNVEEDPDWSWSVEATQSEAVNGIWSVTVKVSRTFGQEEVAWALSSMVLDPSLRGHAADKPTVAGQDATTTGSSTTPSSSSSSTTPAPTPPTPRPGG